MAGSFESTARAGGSILGRIVRAWRALPAERRLAAIAAAVLFLALFLPWYQLQYFVVVTGKPVPAGATQSGWGAFSFVEAAVLLVAAGVLLLLFQRAEGRPFHLPGGDGTVIMAAGVWTGVLVVWRIFDKQGAIGTGHAVTTYGIEWGIFVALADSGLLAWAGSRIRAARAPEPPLPGEVDDWGGSDWEDAPGARPARRRGTAARRPFIAVDEMDEPPEMPTRRLPDRRRGR